jgi:hypothetical protein
VSAGGVAPGFRSAKARLASVLYEAGLDDAAVLAAVSALPSGDFEEGPVSSLSLSARAEAAVSGVSALHLHSDLADLASAASAGSSSGGSVGLSASQAGSASAVPKCLMTQKCAVSGLASAAVLPVASSAMQVGSEEQHEVYSDAEEDLGSSDWEDDGAGSACMEENFYDAPESPPVSAKTARRHARRAIAAAAAALPVRHYRLQSV